MRSLRSQRIWKGFTQIQLSSLTKVTQCTISAIELGRIKPNDKTIQRIEKALGPIDWIETSKIAVTGDYR